MAPQTVHIVVVKPMREFCQRPGRKRRKQHGVHKSPVKRRSRDFIGDESGEDIQVGYRAAYRTPEHGAVAEFFTRHDFAAGRAENDLSERIHKIVIKVIVVIQVIALLEAITKNGAGGAITSMTPNGARMCLKNTHPNFALTRLVEIRRTERFSPRGYLLRPASCCRWCSPPFRGRKAPRKPSNRRRFFHRCTKCGCPVR